MVKYFLRQQPDHLIFDPLEEYDVNEFNVYRPDSIIRKGSSVNPSEEMEILIENVIKPAASCGKLKLFAIDEADIPFPAHEELGFNARQMLTLGRHWGPGNTDGICVLYIARRPVNLNTNVVELADYRVFFTLTGRNDLKYMNDIRIHLDDVVTNLPEYHFATHHRRDKDNKDYHIFSPVDIVEK